MFGLLLFGMKFTLPLFFRFALLFRSYFPCKFSRLLSKLHRLLGFGADAFLSGAGNLALPAFRIGCNGLNLSSLYRRSFR